MPDDPSDPTTIQPAVAGDATLEDHEDDKGRTRPTQRRGCEPCDAAADAGDQSRRGPDHRTHRDHGRSDHGAGSEAGDSVGVLEPDHVGVPVVRIERRPRGHLRHDPTDLTGY